jgi:Protein of unknown function (DUF3054)
VSRDKRTMLDSRPWWIAWDVAVVLVFVAIGRSVHDHGVRPTGLAWIAWPFLAGLGVAWWLIVWRRWNGAGVSGGVAVLTTTVAVGMVLRVVSGQGTAVAFIVVAVVFLGALMVGPRAAAVRRRSRPG